MSCLLRYETKVKDAILSRGGAFDTIPNKAISVGMKEILGAKLPNKYH